MYIYLHFHFLLIYCTKKSKCSRFFVFLSFFIEKFERISSSIAVSLNCFLFQESNSFYLNPINLVFYIFLEVKLIFFQNFHILLFYGIYIFLLLNYIRIVIENFNSFLIIFYKFILIL